MLYIPVCSYIVGRILFFLAKTPRSHPNLLLRITVLFSSPPPLEKENFGAQQEMGSPLLEQAADWSKSQRINS